MTMESDVTAKLLNFTQEPHAYVSYLDSVVDAFFGSNTGNNAVAVRCLDPSPHVLQSCLTSPPRASAALHISPAIGNMESARIQVVVIGLTWGLCCAASPGSDSHRGTSGTPGCLGQKRHHPSAQHVSPIQVRGASGT